MTATSGDLPGCLVVSRLVPDLEMVVVPDDDDVTVGVEIGMRDERAGESDAALPVGHDVSRAGVEAPERPVSRPRGVSRGMQLGLAFIEIALRVHGNAFLFGDGKIGRT